MTRTPEDAHSVGIGAADEPKASAPQAGVVESFTVDELAQEIRRVDGNHDLGSGELAEALSPFILTNLVAYRQRILAALPAQPQPDLEERCERMEALEFVADEAARGQVERPGDAYLVLIEERARQAIGATS